ncbi:MULTISPECIES: hypothetical protein [Photobacterium]|uniref:Uncharacterized protein n=1 Tax=Photobacterium ganghwense TaxID=320778 RepID=A0A0J1JZB6_9GAMM|nr:MULTISPECIES: hypothetical protein [Photobacterium]KLV07577.1 hypothetical protein ABT57_16915 [Photobacterium ganghwense]PSU11572.1 hypothetical protein C9I92_05640 [Photobacterium ganghwense]QSV13688.1 hypothetical protein FH974_13255 [Photobacterium ganghwense]
MRNLLITITLLVVALPTAAAESDPLTLLDDKSKSGWFLTSQSRGAEQFDLWQIDSGYTYALTDKTEVYLSTRLKTSTSTQPASRGLLSGVKYSLSPRLSLQSAVTSETEDRETVMGVEVSSQFEVTDRLNLHATLDYESLEQIYQVGIGFRF